VNGLDLGKLQALGNLGRSHQQFAIDFSAHVANPLA
jgi:hypothetical protein